MGFITRMGDTMAIQMSRKHISWTIETRIMFDISMLSSLASARQRPAPWTQGRMMMNKMFKCRKANESTMFLHRPSAEAQVTLIRDCYRRAGLNVKSICDQPQFFEAHGTGTPAGDPIEAEAISSTFPRMDPSSAPLYVGSIKTIIGHT
jgi:3-oxoacyl-(acyl-carrier-protein) synthase